MKNSIKQHSSKLSSSVYLAVVMAGILLVSGCAASNKPIALEDQTAYVSNPDFSYAKNVASAMGLQPHRLKDARISKESFDNMATRVGSAYQGGTTIPSTALGVALEYQTAPLGLDFGPAAVLSLISSLGVPSSLEQHALYAGWVDPNSPDNMSPSELTEKIGEVVKNYLVEQGFEIKTYSKQASGASFEGAMFVGNERCVDDVQRTKCYIASSRMIDENAVSTQNQGVIFGKMLSFKPDFIGNGKAYIMSGGIIDSVTRSGIKLDRRFDSLSMWVEVSKALPDGFFLYLGPKKYTYTHRSGPISLGLNPLILNKGKVNYFVKVETNKVAQN